MMIVECDPIITIAMIVECDPIITIVMIVECDAIINILMIVECDPDEWLSLPIRSRPMPSSPPSLVLTPMEAEVMEAQPRPRLQC